jgi:SHS2 domain-containing protein
VGIDADGKTIEEAFVNAARATFSLMADPGSVKPRVKVSIVFTEEAPGA